MIRYFVTSNTTSFARAGLKLYFDSPPTGSPQTFYIKEDLLDQTGNVGNNKYNLGLTFSFDRYFVSGTIVAFSTEINNLSLPMVALGISTGGFLSGYLIAQ